MFEAIAAVVQVAGWFLLMVLAVIVGLFIFGVLMVVFVEMMESRKLKCCSPMTNRPY